MYFIDGDLKRAEPALREACELRELLLGANDYRTVRAQNVLARALSVQGRSAEASAILDQAVAAARRHLDELPIFDDLLQLHASVLMDRGEFERAAQLLSEAEARQADVARPSYMPGALTTLRSQIVRDQGDPARAELMLYEVLEMRRERLGE